MQRATLKHRNHTLSVSLETITPEKAAAILARGDVNWRRTRNARVGFYADVMSDGKWDFNGVPILLDQKGRCVDGGHRLAAVVKSQVSLVMLIVQGNLKDMHIDMNQVRNFGQYLANAGEQNTATLAGVVRLSYGYLVKGLRGRELGGSSGSTDIRYLADYFRKHKEDFREAASFASAHQNFVISPSHLAFVYYVGCKVAGAEATEDFLLGAIDGTAEPGSGADMLRRRALAVRRQRALLAPTEKLILIIKAWNNHMLGRMNVKLFVGKTGSQIKLPDFTGSETDLAGVE